MWHSWTMTERSRFVRLPRHRTVLVQNIALALASRRCSCPDITGQATMWMAVFADMGASSLVVFNPCFLATR